MPTVNFEEFEQVVRKCVATACTLFEVPGLNPSTVQITYTPNGLSIGRARRLFGRYILNFSIEALENYYDQMVKDTVPHEVAHLVCFDNSRYGSNHDRGWKRVCRMLGGDDSRTHNFKVTKLKDKVTTYYGYDVGGDIKLFGPKHHKKIQATGRTGIEFRFRSRNGTTYHTVTKDMFVGYQQKKIDDNRRHVNVGDFVRHDQQAAHTKFVPNPKPDSVPVQGSKREMCIAIFKNNLQLTRGQIIDMFVVQVGMTKAGASTYYQNIKSGIWKIV